MTTSLLHIAAPAPGVEPDAHVFIHSADGASEIPISQSIVYFQIGYHPDLIQKDARHRFCNDASDVRLALKLAFKDHPQVTLVLPPGIKAEFMHTRFGELFFNPNLTVVVLI
jgi:hypothetical protein